MWTEGRIEVRGITFHYWVKVYDEGSVYGINEGRISKLTIRNEKPERMLPTMIGVGTSNRKPNPLKR